MYTLIFLGVVGALVGLKSMVKVPPQMRYVILRLGKVHRVADAGTTMLIPIIDQIGARFSTNEREILADGLIIKYRVLEPRKAYEGASNLEETLLQAAQTALKSNNVVETMNRLVHHLGVHITGAQSRFKS